MEFDHVFITGLEENLFPSVISLTSPDQIEEERRLFYVALTRAKVDVTITFAATRFKWGNMEFSRPSRFLKEIDPRYVDAKYDDEEENEEEERTQRRGQIDELRRRYDMRSGRTVVDRREFQSSRQVPSGYGTNQSPHRTPSYQSQARPTTPPRPSAPDVSKMRSVGVRTESEGVMNVSSAGSYAVGQMVSHARFGVGRITALEVLTSDTKITVAFENPEFGTKALLAKFAKLTIL